MAEQEPVVDRYPSLFPENWAFEIGDGWLPLVAELCEQIKDVPVKFGQVKEKFGLLRIYVDPQEGISDTQREALYKAVHATEARSGRVCEACGKPGKLGGEYWVSTLCGGCRAKDRSRRA